MDGLTWKDAWSKTSGPKTTRDSLVLFLKGLLMGIADLIPGVSGGTIAFITGIYNQLLGAISSVDKEFISAFLRLRWKQAMMHIHFRFLVFLGSGVLFSIFSFSRVMHYLLIHWSIFTWSAFLGLIAASVILIAKEVESFWRPRNLSFFIMGTILAYLIVALIPVTTPNHPWFIVLCGMIGISAMILPGLSGSFLLLILGKHEYITGAVKNPFNMDNFLVLITFGCGTALGLFSFSRLLNFLLKSFRNQTMAFLTGIVLGSLRKVWPWKEILETKIIRGKTRVLRDQNIFPEMNSEFYMALCLVILGFVLVIAMDRLSRRVRERI